MSWESDKHDLYNGDNGFSKQNSFQFASVVYCKALNHG